MDMLTKAIQGVSILLIPAWFILAYLSVPLVTGVEIVYPLRGVILSGKNALFFFNIIAVAAMGGYIASKFRHNKPLYITIQVTTFTLVILIAWLTSKIQHSYTI